MTHSLRALSAYVRIHDFLVYNSAKLKITVNVGDKELSYENESCEGLLEFAETLCYHFQQEIDQAKRDL